MRMLSDILIMFVLGAFGILGLLMFIFEDTDAQDKHYDLMGDTSDYLEPSWRDIDGNDK